MLVKIILHKDQALYSIESLAYKFAEATGLEPRQKNVVAADHNEAVDSEILSRMMDLRDARMRKRLRFALTKESGDVSCNNPSPSEEYIYSLNVSDEFDHSEQEIIKTFMHEYLVRGTLRDWYMQHGINTSITADELGEMEENIVSSLRGRSWVKAPMQPFGPQKKMI